MAVKTYRVDYRVDGNPQLMGTTVRIDTAEEPDSEACMANKIREIHSYHRPVTIVEARPE